MKLFLASMAVAALALAGPASADTTFFDGTFNNSDWSQTEFTASNGGASSASQHISGGNPGDFFQIDIPAVGCVVKAPVLVFFDQDGLLWHDRQIDFTA